MNSTKYTSSTCLKAACLGALSIILAACESAPKPPVKAQPVSIKADSFCSVMKRLNPPNGIPTWDVTDTKETIDYNRRIEAAVTKKCVRSRSAPKPKTS